MNFHSLDYFLVLAREKNFTRAAEALHITQQSLSSHIAGLEKELGCTLLVRRTPLELTYAGRKFLHYAESIGQTRQTMEREFCDISENQKGELRVGIGYTRGRAIMPRLIPAFQRQYPNVEIMLRECSNDAIQKALLSGGIDLAIAAFPHPLPGVVLEDYYLEHIVLCLSDGLLAQCGIDLDTHRGEIAAGNLSTRCVTAPLSSAPRKTSAGASGADFCAPRASRLSARRRRKMSKRCSRSACRAWARASVRKIYCKQRSRPSSSRSCTFSPSAPVRRIPSALAISRRSYPWSVLSEFIRIAREQTA